MKGINCYLGIIAILLVFFCMIVTYLRFNVGKFTPLPGVPDVENNNNTNKKVMFQELRDIHFYDSRYQYPYKPPVNPIVTKSILKYRVPVNQENNNEYSVLDSDYSEYSGNSNSNLLTYSGGTTELLKIPLQMNEPNSYEQLRSQDVLITPYNRVKYSDKC